MCVCVWGGGGLWPLFLEKKSEGCSLEEGVFIRRDAISEEIQY